MITQTPTVFSVVQSRHRRKGFTLTEIAIVLGVVGIIIAAIWVAAAQVNEKARISEAVNEFNAVAQNMTSLLQGGYGVTNAPAAEADITGGMITGGVIPQWIGNAVTGNASNPWNNAAGFKMWWVGSSPRTYRMSFYGVSLQGCLGLITQTTNCTPGQSGCPTNVVVGGSNTAYSAGPPGTWQSTTGGGLTSATIQSLCAASGANYNSYPGPANSVEFDFTQ